MERGKHVRGGIMDALDARGDECRKLDMAMETGIGVGVTVVDGRERVDVER